MSDKPNTLLASELIKKLQSIIDTKGDLKVILEDSDTNWYMGVGDIEIIKNSIVIAATGYSEPMFEEEDL